MEYKTVPFEVKDLHDDENDEFFRFSGLASTHDLDRGADKFAPGAFTESLKTISPVILWVHQMREPIGITESIKEVPEGLQITAKLPREDTLVRNRVIPQIKIGSVRAMSVGFQPLETDDEIIDKIWVRTITKADLFEISPVPIPMNPNAVITDFKNMVGSTDANRIIRTVHMYLSDFEKKTKDASLEDVAQIRKIIAKYFEKDEDKDGKAYKFEDVESISDKEGFVSLLKETGIFTKRARECLAKLLPKRGNSDSDEFKVISGFSDEIKKLKQLI